MSSFRGQKTTIATAIRQNLNSYSDSQILDELLQNADDARADTCSFMLDLRPHGTKHVYGTTTDDGRPIQPPEGRMAELQGPALVAFDSAVFLPEDFDGLFSFGQGSKKYDPTRTGKFGLGFNSVYHVTDVPMFVSGEWYVVLDPQKGYYPGLEGNPGLDPGSQNQFGSESYESLRDSFDPFNMPCFGCDMRSGRFDGTLFRFPLRTQEQADRYGQHGLRPGQVYTVQMILQQFERFREDADEKLLFLKHVKTVELWEWRPAESTPRKLYAATLDGPQLHDRTQMTEWLKTQLDSWQHQNGIKWAETAGSTREMLRSTDRHLAPRNTIRFTVQIEEDGEWAWQDEWHVRSGVGLGAAWDAAVADYAETDLTLFPSASVAARVRSVALGGRASRNAARRFVGRAFATLPTQMKTGYPVHVNARWCLENNRTSLKQGAAQSDRTQVQFNHAMIQDTVANLWMELLVQLKSAQLPMVSYYGLWPRLATESSSGGNAVGKDSDWALVIDPLYRLLSQQDVLHVRDEHYSLSLTPTTGQAVSTWTSASVGRWDNLVEPPFVDAPIRVRSAWLTMVLRLDLQKNMMAARQQGQLTSLRRSQSMRVASLKWKRVVRNLCFFFRERGSVASVLVREGCPWLLSTPMAILKQFETSGVAEAREVSPQDVRQYFREKAMSVGFSRDVITRAPFTGLTSTEAVVGVLRYVLSDLEKSEDGASNLDGLPLVPLANGDLQRFGASTQEVFGGAPLIISGPSVLGAMLLGSQHPLLVHPLAAPFLHDWVQHDDVAKHLNIVPMTVAVVAERLGDVLPSRWNKQIAVAWTEQPGEATKAWMSCFWRFLGLQKCQDLSPFADWPIIPVTNQGNPMLLGAKHKNCVLRLRYTVEATTSLPTPTLVPVQLAARSAAVYDVLTNIGVPLLDVSFCAEAELAKLGSTMAGVGIVEYEATVALTALCSCIGELDLNVDVLLKPKERDLLLEYWQAAELSPAHQKMLKRLPLFEKEGSRHSFVSISDRPWSMLPDDIPVSDLRGEFLKHKTQFTALYESLHIEPLTRERFYVDFIFKEIQRGDISEEERGRHMHDVSIHFDNLVARSPSDFKSAVQSLAFVPLESGEVVSPLECFDPREPVFVEFFADRLPSRRHVPPGWTSSIDDWLHFLVKAGMMIEMDRNAFLDVARSISKQVTQSVGQTSTNLQTVRARASRLNRYLISNFETFKHNENPDITKAFFDELSQLSLAQPMTPKFMRPGMQTAPLVPFSSTVYVPQGTSRQAYNLSWSQALVANIPPGIFYIRVEFYRLLHIKKMQVDTVIDHLLFVTQRLTSEQLEQWGWFSIDGAMEEIYTFLAEAAAADDACRKHVRERLSYCRCLLLARHAAAMPTFIDSMSVFTAIETDAPPFAFHPLNLVRGARVPGDSTDFLAVLGVREVPSDEDIVAWLMSIENGEAVLSQSAATLPQSVATAVKLLEMYVENYPDGSSALAQLRAPDTTGAMCQAQNLVIDDAPWLHERIHLAKIPLVHPKIKVDTARGIGVGELSQCVDEVLQVGFDVTEQNSELLQTWTNIIHSTEFRIGIQRIIKHEESTRRGHSSHHLPVDLLDRLASLADLILIGVQQLRSRFIFRPTGENITASAEGSSTILQQEEGRRPRLFILLPGMRQHQLTTNMSIVLNRLVGNCMLNLQPLSSMLNCTSPDEIPSELDFNRISRVATSDVLVGAKLTMQEMERTTIVDNPAQQVCSGSHVVWVESGSSTLRHGIVVTGTSTLTGTCKVQTGASQEQQFRVTDLQRLLTDHEVRIQRAAEADEQAERAALQRASSRASVSVVGGVPAAPVSAAIDSPTAFEPEPEPELKPEPEQEVVEQQNVERTLYKPEDPDWLAQEERLMQRIKHVNDEREKTLLPEPSGIDEVLVQGGFDIPKATPLPGATGSDSDADPVLSSVQEQVVSVTRRPGYDLVRVCNIDEDPERTPQEIAFFHHRGTLDAFDDDRRSFIRQCCGVLREVAHCFGYEPYYVTLFYQAHSVSRFIRQKVMFNCWAIDMYRQAQSLVGTHVRANHEVPLFGTAKECLAGTSASAARYRVLVEGCELSESADTSSPVLSRLKRNEEITVTESATFGIVERVKCERGWTSTTVKGKPVLELLRTSSNVTVRAGETVQVLEVYVSGDRGSQAGGVKLLRCDRGWMSSHDNLQQRLLEPVPTSTPPQPVDVRDFPFTYMYFYGLFAHKLAHFFDVVHGTRHDFFMNEYKIEGMTKWIKLLRRKGWSPAELEAGPYGDQFLKQVVL
eukprot:SAG31_NODE_899_length_11146_cov_7.265049_4_plen_2267_part_00